MAFIGFKPEAIDFYAGLSADNSNRWGATYGNTVLAWRSAVGVTRDGALLFGASDGLSSISLANIMIRAGAVRAMEMDINHVWVTFEQFAPDKLDSDTVARYLAIESEKPAAAPSA